MRSFSSQGPAEAGILAEPSHGPATQLASTLWDTLAGAWAKAGHRAALHGLDDRTLKDIGVHRTEISSILHHGRQDPSRRRR